MFDEQSETYIIRCSLLTPKGFIYTKRSSIVGSRNHMGAMNIPGSTVCKAIILLTIVLL